MTGTALVMCNIDTTDEANNVKNDHKSNSLFLTICSDLVSLKEYISFHFLVSFNNMVMLINAAIEYTIRPIHAQIGIENFKPMTIVTVLLFFKPFQTGLARTGFVLLCGAFRSFSKL